MEAQRQLQDLHAQMRACRKCPLAGHAVDPPPVTHLGPASPVMVVAQAPGALERDVGVPFQGVSGDRLDDWFRRAGLPHRAWRERFYATSITKCYPGKHPTKGDRKPTRAEVGLCAPWLDAQLDLIQPEVELPMGRMALRRFLGRAPPPLKNLVGQRFEVEGRAVIPLPHPSPVSHWLNKAENRERLDAALELVRAEAQRLGLADGDAE